MNRNRKANRVKIWRQKHSREEYGVCLSGKPISNRKKERERKGDRQTDKDRKRQPETEKEKTQLAPVWFPQKPCVFKSGPGAPGCQLLIVRTWARPVPCQGAQSPVYFIPPRREILEPRRTDSPVTGVTGVTGVPEPGGCSHSENWMLFSGLWDGRIF